MKWNKQLIIKTIAIAIAFVLFYAGISKVLEINKFFSQLEKSPLIPYGYSKIAGITTLVMEFVAFYFICKGKIRLSLLMSFGLMFFFSVYIGYLLYFSYYVPCSCGGILGDMSWTKHLIFNTFLTVLAGFSYIHCNEK
jgi:hypothetical protein